MTGCFHAISPRNERGKAERAHKAKRDENFYFPPRGSSAFQKRAIYRHNIYIIGRSIYSKLGQGRVGTARATSVRLRLVMHADDDNAIAIVATNERADAICIGSVAWPICARHISILLYLLFFSSSFFLPFRTETFTRTERANHRACEKIAQSAVCISVERREGGREGGGGITKR